MEKLIMLIDIYEEEVVWVHSVWEKITDKEEARIISKKFRIRALENDNKRLEEENKKLKECNKSQSEVINNVFIPQKERLEEENKNLKEKIKRLEFDVDAWHQLKLLLEWEIERLRWELSANEDRGYKSQKENILMWKIC